MAVNPMTPVSQWRGMFLSVANGAQNPIPATHTLGLHNDPGVLRAFADQSALLTHCLRGSAPGTVVCALARDGLAVRWATDLDGAIVDGREVALKEAMLRQGEAWVDLARPQEQGATENLLLGAVQSLPKASANLDASVGIRLLLISLLFYGNLEPLIQNLQNGSLDETTWRTLISDTVLLVQKIHEHETDAGTRAYSASLLSALEMAQSAQPKKEILAGIQLYLDQISPDVFSAAVAALTSEGGDWHTQSLLAFDSSLPEPAHARPRFIRMTGERYCQELAADTAIKDAILAIRPGAKLSPIKSGVEALQMLIQSPKTSDDVAKQALMWLLRGAYLIVSTTPAQLCLKALKSIRRVKPNLFVGEVAQLEGDLKHFIRSSSALDFARAAPPGGKSVK